MVYFFVGAIREIYGMGSLLCKLACYWRKLDLDTSFTRLAESFEATFTATVISQRGQGKHLP